MSKKQKIKKLENDVIKLEEGNYELTQKVNSLISALSVAGLIKRDNKELQTIVYKNAVDLNIIEEKIEVLTDELGYRYYLTDNKLKIVKI